MMPTYNIGGYPSCALTAYACCLLCYAYAMLLLILFSGPMPPSSSFYLYFSPLVYVCGVCSVCGIGRARQWLG